MMRRRSRGVPGVRGARARATSAASSAEMTSSQEMATYAALTELGYDVPVTLSAAFSATM